MYPPAQRITNGVTPPVDVEAMDGQGRLSAGLVQSAAPSVAAPGASSGVGTAPTIAATAGRTQTDVAGDVQVTVGTAPAAGGGRLFDLTFAQPYMVAPQVIVCESDGTNALPGPLRAENVTTTGFSAACKTTLTATQVHRVKYIVVAQPS